jgi:hypothetical protein
MLRVAFDFDQLLILNIRHYPAASRNFTNGMMITRIHNTITIQHLVEELKSSEIA